MVRPGVGLGTNRSVSQYKSHIKHKPVTYIQCLLSFFSFNRLCHFLNLSFCLFLSLSEKSVTLSLLELCFAVFLSLFLCRSLSVFIYLSVRDGANNTGSQCQALM